MDEIEWRGDENGRENLYISFIFKIFWIQEQKIGIQDGDCRAIPTEAAVTWCRHFPRFEHTDLDTCHLQIWLNVSPPNKVSISHWP